MIRIDFQDGTLLLEVTGGTNSLPGPLEEYCKFDTRMNCWRAEAVRYADIITYLYKNHLPYEDCARAYQELSLKVSEHRQPRFYQQEALNSWLKARRRGIVVLPTGTGKSFLALLAILRSARSTLIVVPTLDLLEQWVSQLKKAFPNQPIGIFGGGISDLQEITVSTYDSAVLRIGSAGNRFGLLIVDECHHLSGETYREILRYSIAPYRLGLTATPDTSADGAVAEIYAMLGEICYQIEIDQLEGQALAPYDIVTIPVELDDDEFEEYQRNREIYINFLHRYQLKLNSSQGWGQFLRACATSPEGREAFKACLKQRLIARNGRSKIAKIWELLQKHRQDRVLIFTADNATAYKIGEEYLLPVLTHYSKLTERRIMLDNFRSGVCPFLVTSKVLNEGVDVPEAGVGIVVSGSGSIREHVQRLGRILRPAPGKTAVLYELVSTETSERYVSERRRQHRAYERFGSM